jgi:hypothetical protein
VARGLETEWEKRLRDRAAAEGELERRDRQRPRALSEEEKKKILSLGSDLHKVWTAPTTTDRDRKELLRTLLEEVIVTVDRPERRAHLTLRLQSGTLTELDLSLPRSQPHGLHTDEDTISLLRRLAVHYPDDVIAGILNRQGRKTANGLFHFTRVILLLANARGLKSEVLAECAARQFHFPLLAGGTIPFIRKYSTICP